MQPKIYSIDNHSITADKIDKHAFYVVEKLKQNGYIAYLVGGSVRDLLLGKKPKDYDISTSAKPEEIKALFRNCILIGKRFRLAHVRFGRKIIEVATFRTGDTETSALIVRDNDFGTEEQDVLRRDFTINGLFYDPESGTIIDYVGGYPDIEKRVLRTIGNPEVRFRQDPVRMIRLLKFKARFDLDIDPKAHAALDTCKEDIVKSSQARIFEELLRMLESGSSSPFFKRLSEYGLLSLLMPNLDEHLDSPEIFHLLDHIDAETKESEFSRSLLATCLLFPIFEKELGKKTFEREPHLGMLSQKANKLIDHIFQPFFHIPRRMRGTMIFILTSQFRFVPLFDKTKRKLRIPKDPNFDHALKFFKIRCSLNPEFDPIYERWKEASIKAPPKKKTRKRRKKNEPTEK